MELLYIYPNRFYFDFFKERLQAFQRDTQCAIIDQGMYVDLLAAFQSTIDEELNSSFTIIVWPQILGLRLHESTTTNNPPLLYLIQTGKPNHPFVQ